MLTPSAAARFFAFLLGFLGAACTPGGKTGAGASAGADAGVPVLYMRLSRSRCSFTEW